MISPEPNRTGRWSRLAALLALGSIYFMPVRAETFETLKLTIRKKFPSVRQLSTQALALWLADTAKPAPLLIDARSREEFAISHLQGARRLAAVSEVKAAVKTNGQPIVVYCSVGYRSSALAEKLQKAGLTNVYNLEGSIFGWANEGRPVFRGTNTTAEVHPYDAKWGKLLDQRYHPRKH
jgi:rhodanese-related sulfurtransferase